MEYVVRFVKGYLWFVFFNKSEKIFLKWIVVVVGMKYIFEEFDKKIDVVIWVYKYRIKLFESDEIKIIKEL